MSLQVYLLLNSLPQDTGTFAALFQQLQQTTRFSLTVINNGQPFNPKRLFHQLGLTFRLQEYPLRFHPAQLLAAQLNQTAQANPLKGEQFLWLEDRLLWHPGHLPNWLTELDNWTWIMPRLLPAKTLHDTGRIYQLQALSAPIQEPKLLGLHPDCFPPCLCFNRSGLPVLKEWLRPEGQLPLLMMGACDTSVPAWHPYPAPEPSQTEFALEIPEALARWQRILDNRDPKPRQQALLESLQRALPDSQAVYARLAPMLEPKDAVELLEIAMRRHLIYPDLLALMAQALMACHQSDLAGVYLPYLQQRFPAFEMPVSPWPNRGGASVRLSAQALPRTARLSVCLIVRDEAEALPGCFASLTGLKAELIVIDTGSVDHSPELALSHGAQVDYLPWQADFAQARNRALELASGDWILMLDADERLDPQAIGLLKNLLTDPPPGLPVYQVPVHRLDSNGETVQIRSLPRLFPRHSLLRYQGYLLEDIQYSGPGELRPAILPGLRLLEIPASPVRQERRLAWLKDFCERDASQTTWLLALADALAEDSQWSEALIAYEQALSCWVEQEKLTDLAVPAVLGRLKALQELDRQNDALKAALEAEKLCQNQPDYWFLLGCLQRHKGDVAGAVQAFERCLELRGDQACLRELAELYRNRVLDPSLEPRRRQQLAQKWLTRLLQLLPLHPDGRWQPNSPSLFLLMAEAALILARQQRGTSALAFYREALPPESAQQSLAYYAETALVYLEGSPAQLTDRLPSDYEYETVRDLQLKPYTLHDFCQALWLRPEIDGPELATALLTMAAFAQQDLSLWLLLSHLLAGSSQSDAALNVLEQARSVLPANPYLLCQLVRLLLEREEDRLAEQRLDEALSLKPDLEDALHLQQLLAAKKHRKRYTENLIT